MTGEFDAVRALFADSRIVGRTRTTARAATAAWASSWTAGRVRALGRIGAGLSPTDRLRACAVAVGAAAGTHVLLLTAVPAYAAPSMPWWLPAGVAAGAILVAILAPWVVASWPDSRLSRGRR